MYNFKREFRHTLSQVLRRYQTARIDLDNKGMTARTSPPPVSKRMVLIAQRQTLKNPSSTTA